MDNLIPINITKAKVVAISLNFRENQLEFRAEVSLLSEYGKPITSIYIGTDNYNEKNNVELSLESIELAKQVRFEIEVAIIRFMNSKQNVIEHKEN